MSDPLRHHRRHDQTAFGADKFGRIAERIARFFGTPQYLVGQTVIVMAWIAVNAYLALAIGTHSAFDPYPFILLNLVFSTQAAYAAPLILLAQTRQADRDKTGAEADARHRQELAERLQQTIDAVHELAKDDTPGGVGAIRDLLETRNPPSRGTAA